MVTLPPPLVCTARPTAATKPHAEREVHFAGAAANLQITYFPVLAARLSLELAERVRSWGVPRIQYTDVVRDGTLVGPNLAAIEQLAEVHLGDRGAGHRLGIELCKHLVDRLAGRRAAGGRP